MLVFPRRKDVRSGFAVETAPDGADAITLCESNTFDVVVSDVMMPRLNGHQLAQWVAINSPSTITVLMSGYDADCKRCANSPRCTLIAIVADVHVGSSWPVRRPKGRAAN